MKNEGDELEQECGRDAVSGRNRWQEWVCLGDEVRIADCHDWDQDTS